MKHKNEILITKLWEANEEPENVLHGRDGELVEEAMQQYAEEYAREFAWWVNFDGWVAGIYEEGMGYEKITHTMSSKEHIEDMLAGKKPPPERIKRKFATENDLINLFNEYLKKDDNG